MEQKDEKLWRMAKKRAEFKRHFYTYIIINAFLWAIWYVTMGSYGERSWLTAWPIWTTLGWGIGIAFNYMGAYHNSKEDMVEREYERLKREQQNKAQ